MGNEPLEHVLVLSVSTMPSMGFKARLAIPVLKAIEVMSRMAVPVVSEPVPAVVGTDMRQSEVLRQTTSDDGNTPAMSGFSFSVTGRPLPTGALMKSKRSASLYTVNLQSTS